MHDLLPDWTDMPEADRETQVRALAMDGKPASLIARSFRNCTRMSVIGLCSRKKIQLKGRAPKPPAQKKPRPKVEARIDVRQVAIAREKAPKIEPDPMGLSILGNDATHLLGIMDIKAHHCRYIHGDPKGIHGYCGKHVQADSSFCPEHHDRVYLGPTR